MNKLVRAFLVVGLTGCGASELQMGVPDAELASTEAPVIVGSVNWTSVTNLSSTSTERARSKAVGYLSIPAKGSRNELSYNADTLGGSSGPPFRFSGACRCRTQGLRPPPPLSEEFARGHPPSRATDMARFFQR